MDADKIFVLGAGAIGSIYGALLSRKKDVTLIGSQTHVEAIRAQGLKFTGDIDQNFRLKADIRITEIPSNTIILLTTKAHDSVRAVSHIKRMLRKDTVILVLQNGLGNEEIVKELVGDEVEVLRGLTMMAAEFLEPGKIRVWKNETIIAKSKTAQEIAALFNDCGLETRISRNITNEVWNKLVLNSVINPLTALFHIRNHEIASDTLKWVRHEIVQECLAIGKAEGIYLKIDLDELDRRILSYTNLSSMCQDVMKKKKTEIDFLNGKIAELGHKHMIPTPVNQTLTCLTKFLEEKPVGARRQD
ncbi:2-dehydropantoate 2-reductase [Candidatus Bathyarchaeota archaeon]|nr:2-dehydropantoate 2-reductase [Candidatus Bathyarchaeota archaeon]